MESRTQAEEFIQKYGRYMGQHRLSCVLNSGKFMIEERAEGAFLYDTSGKRYLDFFLASGVFSLGHLNPVVVNKVKQALVENDFGGVFYFSEAKGELAKIISKTTPSRVEVVLPLVGGGEANDLALKLAMAATGRTEVICAEKSYHGSAGFSDQLGPSRLREWYPLNSFSVKRVPVGDIDALREAITERTAACVFEPIRSLVDGKHPDAQYWQGVRSLCDQYGSQLIIDEVVCGMGRLGTLWGSELDGIQPDMLVAAKGLSGGVFPVAALVLRPSLLDTWGDVAFRSYSSYAWSNAGAVAGRIAIEETRRLLPAALKNARLLEEGLQAIAGLHPEHVRSVKRTGMHLVIEFHEARINGLTFTNEMYRRGVLVHASGAYPDAPGKLFPPLILDAAQIGECLEKAEDVFASC